MIRRVALTPLAPRELASVKLWFEQPGAGSRAAARLARIEAAIRTLAYTPCAHATGARSGTREMVCERHRIVFEVSPDTGDNHSAGNVRVLRIFGPGRLAT